MRNAVLKVRMLAQERGDVGERADGYEGDWLRRAPQGVREQGYSPPVVGLEAGVGDLLGPVQPALAVYVLGGVEQPFQGFRRANAHGHVPTPDEGEHPQGVARGLLDGNVAGDGRDGEQVEIRVAARQHQGHRVVVTGVYVQDHRFRTHARSPLLYRPTLNYLFPSPAYSATENGAEGHI